MIFFAALSGAIFIFGVFETLNHLFNKELKYFPDALITSFFGGLTIFLVLLTLSD
ncbi:hypothetical protein P4V43_28945 [Brevibacillus fortis]|uniref:hypothetical protein n=1 Tax=Brevibacillus fortis TaxID=2126352 RepID=UPI002E1EACB3|nr:hypothetical protein [Brevibacillus fortis]